MGHQNRAGFTIASALVGAALMGIVSIGIYSLIQSGMSGMMNARSGMEHNSLVQSLNLVISHAEVCKDAFYSGTGVNDHSVYSLPAPPANPQSFKVPVARIRMGNSDLIELGTEQDRVKVLELYFQGLDIDSTPLVQAGQPHKRHFVDLVMVTEKTLDGGTKHKRTDRIPLTVYTRDSDNRIDGCDVPNLGGLAGTRVLGMDWFGAGGSIEPAVQPDRLQADITDSTWDRIEISGSWNSSDVGPVSGVIAKNISGGISVAFQGATGRLNVGTLTGGAPLCLRISGVDVLCARRNGSGIRLTTTGSLTAFYTVYVR
jgi:hypothetical protein